MITSVFSNIITGNKDSMQKDMGSLNEFILTRIRNADDVDGFRMVIDDAINQSQKADNAIRSCSEDIPPVSDKTFEKILNRIAKKENRKSQIKGIRLIVNRMWSPIIL